MILSVVKCSVKMSVHERIDIEQTRAGEGTSTEWCAGGEIGCQGGGESDGSERTSRLATCGQISKGGCCCAGSRQSRTAAYSRYGGRNQRQGEGIGSRTIPGIQSLPYDRGPHGARGVAYLPVISTADSDRYRGHESKEEETSPTPQPQGAIPRGGDAAADRWQSP